MPPSADGLFRTAIAAAHPSSCLPPHLPAAAAKSGRLIVLAAGKAAGSMAEVAEAAYAGPAAPSRLTGIAVARQGYGRPTRIIPMIEAGHPIPNAAGLEAAERALALADGAGADDLVLVLLSGGASANWIAPAAGLSLADKQAVTRALLRSGANIGEINTVRKHLSRIKGGRLARAAQPARVVTLAISDVPGDDPAVIGSGPTVPDPTTLADARAIVARYQLDVARGRHARARRSGQRNAEARRSDFRRDRIQADRAAGGRLPRRRAGGARAGYECVMLGDRIEGEARDVAAEHAARALALQKEGRRAVILSGGELTVTIRGQGRGGPNQEYALALALALKARPGSRRWPATPTAPTAARAPRRPGRRMDRPEHAVPGRFARPRSGPFSRRQRFHRVFRPAGRPRRNRTDLDQRERFSRHRR